VKPASGISRPYELFIAARYLRSKNKNRFVSFISLISVMGIALAVAVLLVVLSVMNGFEHEVRSRILAVVSHASISGFEGRLEDWEIVQDLAAAEPGVRSTAPFIDGQGMLVSGGAVAGVQLRGIEPGAEAETSAVEELVVDGSLQQLEPGGFGLLLGQALADRLGVVPGDRVVALVAQGLVTPAGIMPRMRRFEVLGTFNAGMYEFDRSLAYLHIEDAAKLFRLTPDVTGVRLSVRDPMAAPQVVRNVARSYGGGVYVSDWTRQHANFFRSIELTKSIIFVILLLVVAVAAFNIVSTLVMVVRDKRAEIAILRTMGAPPSAILLIFMCQGTMIGLVGTLGGLCLGVLVSWNLSEIVGFLEGLLRIRFLAPDVYFISELPSRMSWPDVLRVCGIAFILAVLSTLYPAWRGAGTNPADALRHD